MPISRSFYFIRHGQTDWNAERRLQGSKDIPLNNIGIEQANSAIPYFKNLGIDLVYSSPLKRAYKTGQIIAEAIDAPLKTHENLRERSFGSNEGRLSSEVKEEYKNNPNIDVQLGVIGFPHAADAEPYDLFKNRVLTTIDSILNQYIENRILISAHGGFFKSLSHTLCGEYLPSDNAVPYYFEKLSDQKWNIQKVTL